MDSRERFVVTKGLVAGILALLGMAFLAGVKAHSSIEAEAKPIAVAGLVPMQDAVTAEQLRNLTTTISTLQTQLGETIKQVSELNGRLNRLEGAYSAGRRP